MNNNNKNLLESIIQILEERGKSPLDKTFSEIVFNLFDCDSVVFFQCLPKYKTEFMEVTASLPDDSYLDRYELINNDYGSLRIKPEGHILDCIKSHKVFLEEQSDTSHVIQPVMVSGNLSGLLDIYGFNSTPENMETLVALLNIYSNFVSVLEDNEKDTLTGLLNRKTYDGKLIKMLSRINPKQKKVNPQIKERRNEKKSEHHWLGILDIDYFKKINDEFGHLYGDEILLLFSNLMKKIFRNEDLLFRYGGEEFVVVLRPSPQEDVFKIFERFRKELELYKFPRVGHITVSIGIVMVDLHDHPSTIFMKADKALYYAKGNGRNQICDYNQLIKESILVEKEIENDVELF